MRPCKNPRPAIKASEFTETFFARTLAITQAHYKRAWMRLEPDREYTPADCRLHYVRTGWGRTVKERLEFTPLTSRNLALLALRLIKWRQELESNRTDGKKTVYELTLK